MWASPQVVNNVVLNGIASHTDQPCTRGRMVALDLDTGTELWTTRTAPDRICEDDTTQGCALDGDCPSGRCVGMCTNDASIPCQSDGECGEDGPCGDVIGGGVTATAATSVDGSTVYMASVGCFTSPRVGNADRIFSLDIRDGSVDWALPDSGTESFADGPPYRDYGFLNGPIVLPGAAVLAASKDGQIYAQDPITGADLGFSPILGEDVADGFAAFGWFNGAPAYGDGRIYASGYGFDPFGDPGRCAGDASTVCSEDADCETNGPCNLISHLRAYDATTGAQVWEESANLGPTFGSVAYAGGVVFVGSSGIAGGTEAIFAFDAANGTLLTQLPIPNLTSSGPAIHGGELFVGFGPNLPGTFLGAFAGPGGIIAFELPE
jgi:outer membrane protein assembly factor BamB